MRKSNYEVVAQDAKHVLIRDVGPWDQYLTVTNAAEEVVAELEPILKGRRLEYIDSAGRCAVLRIVNGKFAGFDPR
jgi:hypothetical protein